MSRDIVLMFSQQASLPPPPPMFRCADCFQTKRQWRYLRRGRSPLVAARRPQPSNRMLPTPKNAQTLFLPRDAAALLSTSDAAEEKLATRRL